MKWDKVRQEQMIKRAVNNIKEFERTSAQPSQAELGKAYRDFNFKDKLIALEAKEKEEKRAKAKALKAQRKNKPKPSRYQSYPRKEPK